MRVRCDNQYKPGADGGVIMGQPMLFECMGICVLSPAHESEMRGYFVYLLIVKYFFFFFIYIFCLYSGTVYKTGRPYRAIFSELKKKKFLLEGSVNHIGII